MNKSIRTIIILGIFLSSNSCDKGVIDSIYYNYDRNFIFLSYESGDYSSDLFMKNTLDDNIIQITSTPYGIIHAVLHPFENKLIFTVNSIAFADSTYILDLNSWKSTLIHLGDFGTPNFSPDGRKILFNDISHLKVLDLSDLSEVQITNDDRVYRSARFSPDGSKIICQSFTDRWEVGFITIMNTDGTNISDLTECNVPFANPYFIFDMSKILYTGKVNQIAQIFCYDLISNKNYRIIESEYWDSGPSFNHQFGHKMAFVRKYSGNYEILIYDFQTESIINISNNESSDVSPFFLDKDRLVFNSDRSGNWDIYIYHLQSKYLFNITRSPREDYSPIFLR